MFTNMNNNVSRNLTSLKWEAKNTYLVMPARRHFYPPVVWRTGGLARRFYGGPASRLRLLTT